MYRHFFSYYLHLKVQSNASFLSIPTVLAGRGRKASLDRPGFPGPKDVHAVLRRYCSQLLEPVRTSDQNADEKLHVFEVSKLDEEGSLQQRVIFPPHTFLLFQTLLWMLFAIWKADTKNDSPIDVSVPLSGSQGASLLLSSQSEACASSEATVSDCAIWLV